MLKDVELAQPAAFTKKFVALLSLSRPVVGRCMDRVQCLSSAMMFHITTKCQMTNASCATIRHDRQVAPKDELKQKPSANHHASICAATLPFHHSKLPETLGDRTDPNPKLENMRLRVRVRVWAEKVKWSYSL